MPWIRPAWPSAFPRWPPGSESAVSHPLLPQRPSGGGLAAGETRTGRPRAGRQKTRRARSPFSAELAPRLPDGTRARGAAPARRVPGLVAAPRLLRRRDQRLPLRLIPRRRRQNGCLPARLAQPQPPRLHAPRCPPAGRSDSRGCRRHAHDRARRLAARLESRGRSSPRPEKPGLRRRRLPRDLRDHRPSHPHRRRTRARLRLGALRSGSGSRRPRNRMVSRRLPRGRRIPQHGKPGLEPHRPRPVFRRHRVRQRPRRPRRPGPLCRIPLSPPDPRRARR